MASATQTQSNRRAEALAQRLEAGAAALATLAGQLTDEQWKKPLPPDGRTVGVIIHHVASVYPLEIEGAKLLGLGQPLPITWDAIHTMNHDHADKFANVTKEDAIALLKQNSAAAAEEVRALTEEQLDAAGAVGLNADAPLTCQFFLEDHAVRHSYHHAAKIRKLLGK